jgi:hypothetical protein
MIFPIEHRAYDVHNGTVLASRYRDFRLPGVQSVMANNPFLLDAAPARLLHLPIKMLSMRGGA